MSRQLGEIVKVSFQDVISEGIPSIKFNVEVDEAAHTRKEPTPAMWAAIYLSHLFVSGQFMKAVEEYVTSLSEGTDGASDATEQRGT
jgi:hypothetical protein